MWNINNFFINIVIDIANNSHTNNIKNHNSVMKIRQYLFPYTENVILKQVPENGKHSILSKLDTIKTKSTGFNDILAKIIQSYIITIIHVSVGGGVVVLLNVHGLQQWS